MSASLLKGTIVAKFKRLDDAWYYVRVMTREGARGCYSTTPVIGTLVYLEESQGVTWCYPL